MSTWIYAQVEDYTGKGLDDLKAGIIRTPLPPVQTFLDGKRLARYSHKLVIVMQNSFLDTSLCCELWDILTTADSIATQSPAKRFLVF